MHKHIVLLNDKTIIELDFPKYRDLSVSRKSIICLCLRHRQIIDPLVTDKSRYFAQPRPIIVYYFGEKGEIIFHLGVVHHTSGVRTETLRRQAAQLTAILQPVISHKY